MPWRPRAASFRCLSPCFPSASYTCFGAAASRCPGRLPPDCGVSSSSDLILSHSLLAHHSDEYLHMLNCEYYRGHTAEMMNVVTAVQKDRFTPRYYVAALTDNMSLQKAQVYEQSLIQSGEKTIKDAHFVQIYRSREVGQSYFTSIGTTLLATLHAMWLVIRIRPQVIFCNGPGTCFPLCVCAFVLKVLGLGWSSIFYIESIARVKKLSLSGLLLYKLRIADQFFVQWPQLQQKYPRADYAGRLM